MDSEFIIETKVILGFIVGAVVSWSFAFRWAWRKGFVEAVSRMVEDRVETFNYFVGLAQSEDLQEKDLH